MRAASLLLVSAAAVVWGSTLAVADPAASTATAQAATPANDPNEIVCQTMAPETGTRLGARRECHTRREWDQYHHDSQTALTGAQLRGFSEGHAPGGN